MNKRIRADEAFEQALQGGLPPASDEMAGMHKLASALSAGSTALPTPDQRFRARLRNELLAAGAYQAAQEEDLFAAMLDGETVEASAEMRQLVKVASALEPAQVPSPDPAFRYQLRSKLIAVAVPSRSVAMRIGDAVTAWNSRMRRNLRVMGAMSVAVFMLLGAGASLAASRDSLPGDFLYPLKRFQESAQVVGTSGAERGVKLLGLARVRLAEVDALLDRGEQDGDLFTGALNTMDDLTDQGRDLILETYSQLGDPEPLRALAAFAREQAADLSVIVPRLPPAARAIAEESLIRVESIGDDAIQRLVALCAACRNEALGAAQQPALGTDGTVIGCACDQAGFSSQGGGSGATPGTDDPNDPDPEPSPEPTEDPDVDVDEPKTVDLPDLPGDADEDAEDLIDDLIDPVKTLTPTPVPSPLPSLPSALPGL